MMGWLVRSSITFRLLVVAAAAAVTVVGITQLRQTSVDVLPEFLPPTVELQTEALGLSAAEVEQLITVPMEQDLLVGVAFLDDIHSESLPGLSRIFLVFEPGTDLYRARQVVAERLTQAFAQPNVGKPSQMLQPLSATNRVLIVGASTKTLSPIQMGVLARWTIAPRLVGVEGVSNVSVWGFRDRQLQVQVDPETLRDRNVSLEQVVETTGNALWFSPLTFVEASTPGTGGFIDTPNQRLGVQHLSPINSAIDLAKVRVEGTGDRRLVLGDVATVVEDHQPLIGDALVGQGNGDLLFVVEKLPGANTLEVTRGLESAIAAMKPGLPGVQFNTTVYRPASYLEEVVDNLGLAALVGGMLAALVIAAFFLRWRTAVISIVVVPLSLLVAALVLDLLGTSMNMMIVLGLAAALVLVIDDAVVGVDHVAERLRRRSRDGDGSPAADVILDATLEARGVTAYATLIVVLALLPLFFLEGLAGSFFPDVAGAFLLALLASMLVAFTVTPALAVLLLSRASLDREAPLASWVQRVFARALGGLVARRRWAFLATGAVVVAAGIAIPFLSVSLLPTFKEQQVLIRLDGPRGTSLPEMNRVTARASRELRAIPGVDGVGAHVGRAVASDSSANANSAELWVSIDRSADYDGTMNAIRNVVDGYPGLTHDIAAYSNERARDVLSRTGPERDVVVRLYGEDAGVLRAQAERVRGVMAGVDGVKDPTVELPADEPTVEIEVDLAAAEARGIKPGDVRRAAATLLGGLVVGNLFEQQKVFEVTVWGKPDTRGSLTSIRRLLIDTPDGRHVRLGDVADVRIAPNPSVIQRQGVSRYLDIAADVKGRDRGSVVGELESRLSQTRFPLEYTTQVLGKGGQPTGRLIGLGLAAAALIFLLYQACLGSWRLAALCLVTFPIAVSGGVLAALIDGGTLSFGSFVALFAIFGLAVRNGLQMIQRFRGLELTGGEEGRTALVVRGARERAAPIVATATAGAVALLPLVVMGSIAGYEPLHPMAVVMLGGLVTSTWLSLFVVPVVYLQFGRSPVPEPAPTPTGRLVEDLLPPAPVPAPAVATTVVQSTAVTQEPGT
ncbi:MAG TPA: efflux RND transporter permease subunit [Gaiella sp.]